MRFAWARFAALVNRIACHPAANTVDVREQLLRMLTAQACLYFGQPF